MAFAQTLFSFTGIPDTSVSPSHIAGGVALGAIVGLTPLVSLHNIIVLLLILALPVHLGATALSFLFFSLASLLIDPLAHLFGYFLLVKAEPLVSLWTTLYNMPLIPFTRFYNTIVLGSLLISLIIFVPLFLATKNAVLHYRTHRYSGQ